MRLSIFKINKSVPNLRPKEKSMVIHNCNNGKTNGQKVKKCKDYKNKVILSYFLPTLFSLL